MGTCQEPEGCWEIGGLMRYEYFWNFCGEAEVHFSQRVAALFFFNG